MPAIALLSTIETGEATTFWICGALAVMGALGMLLSRKAVHSALWIALTMINLACLYMAQGAIFLGMVQIIVYTGAVMMLFLFVLMLVGVDSADSLVETIRGQRLAALLVGLAFAVMLVGILGRVVFADAGTAEADAVYGGNVQGLAALIFNRYLLAFEVTSALLITAAIGAMILAFRERFEPKLSQADLSKERFLGDEHPGALPPPGVYARHNAVDTPALLPDGSLAENSVPASLKARGSIRPIQTSLTNEVSQIAAGHASLEGEELS
jgi:NADH-quinone oxidoreductase subunit J